MVECVTLVAPAPHFEKLERHKLFHQASVVLSVSKARCLGGGEPGEGRTEPRVVEPDLRPFRNPATQPPAPCRERCGEGHVLGHSKVPVHRRVDTEAPADLGLVRFLHSPRAEKREKVPMWSANPPAWKSRTSWTARRSTHERSQSRARSAERRMVGG